jgi:hypothetical protein
MTSRPNQSEDLRSIDGRGRRNGTGSTEPEDAAGGAAEPEQLALAEILNSASAPRLAAELAHRALAPLRRAPPTPDSDRETSRSPSRTLTSRLSGPELERAPILAEEAAIATAQAALLHASALGHQLRAQQGETSLPAAFSGKMLRSLRESRGLALHELADRTRIAVKHLENIEGDRYNALPPTVYLRGILRSLARELKLDPVRVSSSYIALASEAKARRDKR